MLTFGGILKDDSIEVKMIFVQLWENLGYFLIQLLVTLLIKKFLYDTSVFTLKISVTRVGDFLHFGQLFKAFCNNEFSQISYIIRQF